MKNSENSKIILAILTSRLARDIGLENNAKN